MKKLQKFLEYYTENPSEELLNEFLEWVGSKLGVKIGEYLGGGVEGRIYAIDKNRAIKFGYSNVTSSQYLSSKNLPGVMKIYQTGQIEAPKRFKGGYKPNDYSYDGLWLLNPERTSGLNDFTIGYTIMERITTSLYLKNQLEIINSYLWRDFVRMKWVRDERGNQTRVIDMEGYHESTKKAIEEALNGFGTQTLKTLFKNINDREFVDDLRDCLYNAEFEANMKEEVNDRGYTTTRPVTYKMEGKFKKEIEDLFEDLLVCFKSIDKIGVDWGDIHPDQFGYNSKGELVAYDISFGFGEYDRETKKTTYRPEYIEASKKKVKNVIREFNSFLKSK